MKKYGEITLKSVGAKGGYGKSPPMHWCIKAEPHVRVRIKRVFGRIEVSSQGVIVLLDTPEICRDLIWFLTRYPMKISPKHRARMDERAAYHSNQEAVITRILEGEYKSHDVKLEIPPRDYQRLSIEMAIHSRGLLLADEVGLGKTVTGIGLLAADGGLPGAVVTLTHLTRQWEREIERFSPSMRVFVARTTDPSKDLARHEKLAPLFRPDVFVLNYHKLAGWATFLANHVKTVVFDEAQELRRAESSKYHSAKRVSVNTIRRIALSATPIYNYGGEVFNVLDVIAPDAIGSRNEFEREWCGGRSLRDPQAFGSYLRDSGLMLRRTRSDVGRELPGLSVIPMEIDFDQRELDKVEDAASELARIILAQGGYSSIQKLRASEELSWRLRQATGIAKARTVAEFVRILVEQGEKVVLFGWHREFYNLIRSHLEELKPVFITGEESVNQKQQSFDSFVSGSSKVLVMSLRAGAGLDGLQKVCRTVVIGELDWSPGVIQQCIGRVARDGQADKVVAYVLVSTGGSDPVVADTLGLKKLQSEGLLNPSGDLIEKLEIDEGHIKRLAERHLAGVGAKGNVKTQKTSEEVGAVGGL